MSGSPYTPFIILAFDLWLLSGQELVWNVGPKVPNTLLLYAL